MTDINQSLRQASVRAVTSTTRNYEGDWHALFDIYGIPAGEFNGRMLAWLNGKLGVIYTTLPEAEAAFAASLGLSRWTDIGTFTVGSLFAPATDLATELKAWWSADDLTNGAIASWADRIGGLTLVQATGSLQPIKAANSVNSAYAGVTFDGTDDLLNVNSVANLPTGATAGEIHVLGVQPLTSASAVSSNFISYGGTTASTARGLHRARVTTVSRLVVQDGTTNSVDTVSVFEGVCAFSGHWAGTTEGGRINGTACTPSSTTIATLNTGTTRTRMGFNNAGSNPLNGTIRHGMITTTLSDLKRLKTEAWMLWDVGLQANLPASHPYRLTRP